MKRVKPFIYSLLLICSLFLLVSPLIMISNNNNELITFDENIQYDASGGRELYLNDNIELLCKIVAVIMIVIVLALIIYDKQSKLVAKTLILVCGSILVFANPISGMVSGVAGVTGATILLITYKGK